MRNSGKKYLRGNFIDGVKSKNGSQVSARVRKRGDERLVGLRVESSKARVLKVTSNESVHG